MSESMVERVARAIYETEPFGTAHGHAVSWGAVAESQKDGFRWKARAAIEAMREPTGDMRIAGAHVHDQRPSEAAATFAAMIDAALTPAKVDEAG